MTYDPGCPCMPKYRGLTADQVRAVNAAHEACRCACHQLAECPECGRPR